MTDHTEAASRTFLVEQHHEQLYRLALMVALDGGDAAALVRRSFDLVSGTDEHAEAALALGLLPHRPRRRLRWQPGAFEIERSRLDQRQANTLVGLLALREPAARLTLALHFIRGLSVDEVAALLGQGREEAAETIARFCNEAASALGLVPPDADGTTVARVGRWLDGRLSEQAALDERRRLFEDRAERNVRDGLQRARELLPQAVPALFAGPPRALREQLVAREQPPQAVERPPVRTGALGGLAVAVLLLVLAIIFGPGLLPAADSGAASNSPRSAAEIVEASIRRFEQPPLASGILRERYRVQLDRPQTLLIERTYDYGTPNRLSMTVRTDGDVGPPRQAVSSDGRSLIQFRHNDRQIRLDVQVSEQEARQAMPILRNAFAPSGLFGGFDRKPDISGLFLGQAREYGASFLGTTTYQGRDGWLLRYQTDQPPTLSERGRSESAPTEVLLTIDAQTYALLDVALIAAGAGESTARHPWSAELVEVTDEVGDDAFQLQLAGGAALQTGLGSVFAPEIDDEQFVSLERARRTTSAPLLVPQQLPDDDMRGLVLSLRNQGFTSGELFGMLYEGEYQSVFLAPSDLFGTIDDTSWELEERSAGPYRYQITRSFASTGATLAAEVRQPDAADRSMIVLLFDPYGTEEERADDLEQLIESLTPVTAENVATLQQRLLPAPVAGGE